MRREPIDVFEPPEYARPVMPAGLSEDQQDEVLARLMDRLMGKSPGGADPGSMKVWVRVIADDGAVLDDDVVEF